VPLSALTALLLRYVMQLCASCIKLSLVLYLRAYLGPEVMILSCLPIDVHLICINNLSLLIVCLNLLICELSFTCVCIASCNLSAYICYVLNKVYLLTCLHFISTHSMSY